MGPRWVVRGRRTARLACGGPAVGLEDGRGGRQAQRRAVCRQHGGFLRQSGAALGALPMGVVAAVALHDLALGGDLRLDERQEIQGVEGAGDGDPDGDTWNPAWPAGARDGRASGPRRSPGRLHPGAPNRPPHPPEPFKPSVQPPSALVAAAPAVSATCATQRPWPAVACPVGSLDRTQMRCNAEADEDALIAELAMLWHREYHIRHVTRRSHSAGL
jgi:hypothetical protein